MRRAQMLLCIEGVLYFSVHFRLFLPSGSSHLSTVKFYREQKETVATSLRVEIIFLAISPDLAAFLWGECKMKNDNRAKQNVEFEIDFFLVSLLCCSLSCRWRECALRCCQNANVHNRAVGAFQKFPRYFYFIFHQHCWLLLFLAFITSNIKKTSICISILENVLRT